LSIVPASLRRCSVNQQIPTPNTGHQTGIAQHAALQAARKLQRTETFQQRYALRAGVEATISQGVRAFDLRRSRSVGLPKTHVQHLAIATAINLVRLVDWFDGNPLAPTRVSAFERLSKAA
jgi:transposase